MAVGGGHRWEKLSEPIYLDDKRATPAGEGTCAKTGNGKKGITLVIENSPSP
jgi:hypothetical protein